jgi:hypothetical protein
MKNTLLLALSIAVALVAQTAAVCEAQYAQYGDVVIANAMVGHHLYNLFGQDLGRIQKVTFDDYGTPAFIIVSIIGSNKIVPIPFSALVPSYRPNRFTVAITIGQLRNMPGYSINALDSF